MDKFGRQGKFGADGSPQRKRISNRKRCPRGYTMNPINGSCQESVSIYQSQPNNNFPILTRDVPDCCTSPNRYGTCYFGCVPCGAWINGVYEYEPGNNCFEITGTIDCPAGSEMYAGTESYINDDGDPDTRAVWTSFMSEACMFKLDMMRHSSLDNCPEIYGQEGGSITVSCECRAFKNYQCPGQVAPAGCTDPDDVNFNPYSFNDNACAGPKMDFRRGGRINRRR